MKYGTFKNSDSGNHDLLTEKIMPISTSLMMY